MTSPAQPDETSPADRLAFETLIADTSARLMAAAPSEVDAAVESALDQVRLFFGADRCGLMAVSPDRQVIHPSHVSYGEGVQRVPKTLNVAGLFPWAAAQAVEHRRPIVVPRVSAMPPEAAVDRATFEALGTRAQLTVPIVSHSAVTHLMILAAVSAERDWPELLIPRLRLLGEMMVAAVQSAEAFDALQVANAELRRFRDRLERENVYLRKQVAPGRAAELVAGHSPAIRRALDMAEQVASTNATVLLMGETGTGKERFAEYIHQASPRRGHHMVRVNCSAIPSALIESELFGRERGAYTGALSKQMGRFELAQGSTLFLDEIGDLPMEVQVKLLRVLQEHTIERLGNPVPIAVDVRIIAATHRNLEAAVRAGTFRADLYYRLNVFPIVVPPLRDRKEDIPKLVDILVAELANGVRKRFDTVERASLEALAAYDWPGNVRELRNVLERAMILATGPSLTVTLPPVSPAARASSAQAAPASAPSLSGPSDLRGLERAHILRVLEQTGWRVRGSNAAAEILGLRPTTLEARMAKLGIRRPAATNPD